jgi:periplasmic protein TonB
MFEDSLVESTGRIQTRTRWFAIGSFLLQAVLLTVLILIPYFAPASLPKQALTMLLTAPPPPPMRAALPEHAAAARASRPMIVTAFTAPSLIPQHAAAIVDDGATSPGLDTGMERIGSGNVIGAMAEMGPAPPVVVQPKPKQGPVRISAGVAAGRLLAPIRPTYPAIARAARVQGTVVVEAIISRTGTIESLHVVSGPVMLQNAALEAIREARYRPYLLNGEPTEVQTTITVNFRMGG